MNVAWGDFGFGALLGILIGAWAFDQSGILSTVEANLRAALVECERWRRLAEKLAGMNG